MVSTDREEGLYNNVDVRFWQLSVKGTWTSIGIFH